MKLKLKEKLNKIKIRQRFVNLKERVKEPKTKQIILFIIVGGSLLFYPLSGARALEDVVEAVEKVGPLKEYGRKTKLFALTITGLKVCTDPTAPPIKKAIAGAKLVCCGGYAGANLLSSVASFTPQTKIISSACCGVSWLALSGLEYLDAKAN